MKLYYAPGTCALACWIALEWAQLDYEIEKVKLGSEEYLKINPLGMVPALQLDDGQIVTQAGTILTFIAKQAPKAQLIPQDNLLAECRFNEIMDFLTGDFHPAFWPMFSPYRYTISQDNQALEEVRQASYKRIDIVMTHLDGLIGDSGHVYQNQKTIADAYAYVMALWSQKTPKSYENYPHLATFMAKMEEDSAVQKVLNAAH
ncbi:UNVERIFIED_CONTAM: glutathione S-transferase N-terminal domain-containing protein [Streptococcus canis]|uniref:glutathione S-transferase family protein n=1 Tax=Streptococcus canis TaxID=1329 RepID=UPI0024DE040E|nr:glutathione S-transferase N-terminal domain-containing protein [Streptococcus canis]